MMVDTLSVFYYEKMVGYTPSSFADLVFIGKMIEVGLKRGKSDHHALINAKKKKKTRENEEGENEGEAHAVTAQLNHLLWQHASQLLHELVGLLCAPA